MIVLVTLLLFAAAAPASPAVPLLPVADDDLSLEALLERYRNEQQRLFDTYRVEVESVATALEAVEGRDRDRELEQLRGRLLDLGPQATPLLVPYIDPGLKASDGKQRRSAQVTQVLLRLSTRAVTPQVIEVLEKGSLEGQRNAIRVLGASDDPERAGEVLREKFTGATSGRRGELITAIATLGTPADFEFLGEVLGNQDPDVVRSAIASLTATRCSAAGPKILDLVRATLAAASHVDAICAYYRACPEVVDEEHCAALVRFATSLTGNSREAEKVLFTIGEFEDVWSKDAKQDLKQLADSPSTRIREAAMICLVRAGDRGMRRKLLEAYDERIEENGRLASAWQNRADVKFRIGDYKGAIKDYTEAMRKSEAYLRTEPEIYIGLARANARLGKPKDAADWLDQGSLSIAQLHVLARDPDFDELRADAKLAKVFRLGEE